MGVGASLMSNDCSFPAERACMAPAFRQKMNKNINKVQISVHKAQYKGH